MTNLSKQHVPIYNETSVRQGKSFWHYGKEFETIKRSLGSYVERSTFIGAYLQDELIGFIKITWVGETGTITQILSMKKSFRQEAKQCSNCESCRDLRI